MTMKRTDWNIYCWQSRGARERRRRRGPLKVSFYAVCCWREREEIANTGSLESKKMKGKKRPAAAAAAPKELKF